MADEARQAAAFVRYKIKQLAERENESAVRATLANLRRGVGRSPGSAPETWTVTLGGLPKVLLGETSEPTRGEWAVYTALTLYALHQQGKDLNIRCMSAAGQSLGTAVRRLVEDPDDEKRVNRRLAALATSDSVDELSHHLRGLVQLLKAKDFPLDYPSLTEDLYWYQFPDARNAVRLRWGRDFYRVTESNDM